MPPPVKVKFEAEVGAAQKGIASLQKSISNFAGDAAGKLGMVGKAMEAMGPSGLAAGAALGVIAAGVTALGVATYNAVKGLIDLGGQLSDLEGASGVGTESLQKLGFAAKMVGDTTADVGQAIKAMQKNITEGGSAFEQLGIDMARLKTLAPERQFLEITKAIKGISTSAGQTAAAMDIFGRGASTALKLMRSDAEGAMKTFEDIGGVLGKDTVDAADALGDELDTLGTAWDAVQNNLAAAIVENQDVREAIGSVRDMVGDFAKTLQENKGGIKEFFSIIVDLATSAAFGIRKLAEGIGFFIDVHLNALKSLGIDTAGGGFIDAFIARIKNANAAQQENDALFGDVISGASSGGKKDFLSGDALQKLKEAQSILEKVAVNNDIQRGLEAVANNFEDIAREADRAAIEAQAFSDALALEAGEVFDEMTKDAEELSDNEAEAAQEARALALAQQDAAEAAAEHVAHLEAMANAFGGISGVLGDLQGLLGAIGVGADSFIGKLVGGLGSLAQAGQNFFGAMASGNVFGMIGAGIQGLTSIIGTVKGLFDKPEWKRVMTDVGRRFGVQISQGLAEAIQATADQTGLGRHMAELLHLSDIMGESGRDPRTFATQIQDLFNAVAGGAIPAADGIREIGEAFTEVADAALAAGEVGDKTLVAMIQNARNLGLSIPEIDQFVDEQLSSAAEGVGKIIDGLALTKFGNAEAAATIFSATFWATVKEKGVMEAAAAFKDIFAQLKGKLKDLGFEMPEALDGISRIFRLAEDPNFAGAMTAIDGLKQALEGLANAGYLTMDSFNAFGTSALEAFNQAIKGGAETEDALLAIAPLLQSIISAALNYGFEIPPEVLELIQNAEDFGIKFKEDPLVRIADLLEAIAIKLGAIAEGADAAGDAMSNMQPPPVGGGNYDVPYENNPPKGYAEGGIATGPESGYWELLHGTEAVIPLNDGSVPKGIGATVNMGGITINVSGAGDPKAVATEVNRLLRNNAFTAGINQYAR